MKKYKLYKIQPYYTHQINTDLTTAEAAKYRFHVGMRDSVGVTTAGVYEPSPTTSITGGWNTTDMSTQDSITWANIFSDNTTSLYSIHMRHHNIHYN